MRVDLIAYTPEPIRVLWTAARTCYSPLTPQELWDGYPIASMRDMDSPGKVIKLLRSLWERGHQSVFEHVSLTYAVSGVSRVLLAQYSRHRIGVSLSVQSQRHVRYGGDIVWPDSIVPGGKMHRPATEDAAFEAYVACRKAYDRLIALGVPPEDARFVLPQGTATNFVTTVNLRSLMHLYRLRVLESGAQWEICDLVREMVRLAAEAIPELPQIIPEVNGDARNGDT
ncbi:MAG: FAD-dependent thymidylate synthase [Moorellales bacterium]